MPWPAKRWLLSLLAVALTAAGVLVIVDWAGGPDVLGWTTTPIYAAIVLWFVVPELRQPQTRAMRALLWVAGACAVLLLAGAVLEQTI